MMMMKSLLHGNKNSRTTEWIGREREEAVSKAEGRRRKKSARSGRVREGGWPKWMMIVLFCQPVISGAQWP